jgi:hypothetical protein
MTSHFRRIPSGSNAALETVRRIYGAAGHAITFSATIPIIGLTTLRCSKLQDISADIDDARIYGGMHFRFAQVAGAQLGRDRDVRLQEQPATRSSLTSLRLTSQEHRDA